jgi:hypothetical protein
MSEACDSKSYGLLPYSGPPFNYMSRPFHRAFLHYPNPLPPWLHIIEGRLSPWAWQIVSEYGKKLGKTLTKTNCTPVFIERQDNE